MPTRTAPGAPLNPNPKWPFWVLAPRPLVPRPPIATLTDAFAALDAAKWTTTGTVAITGGKLDITPGADPNYSRYESTGRYSLVGSSAHVEVAQLAIGDSSVDTEFRLTSDNPDTGANRLELFVEGSTIYFRSKINSVFDTSTLLYDPIMHRWWRFSETGGVVSWWTSPNGVDWTLRKTKAWVGFDLSALQVALRSGWWSGGGAPTAHALFDNFNGAQVATIALDQTAISLGGTFTKHPKPLGVPGEWNLVFSDEFQDTTLDTTKWHWDVNWNVLGTPDPVQPTVSANCLHLLAKDTGGGTWSVQTVQSGVFGDPTPFAFTYGYVEFQIKLAWGQGLFPAVWLVNYGNDTGSEIDLGEWLCHAPNETFMTCHFPASAGGGFSQGNYLVTNFADGYHTIGCDWHAGEVVWYIDGVERFRVTDVRVPALPMYVILDHWVSNVAPGAPNDPLIFPADMKVNYVRVWQK
jgi:hypothetical protein